MWESVNWNNNLFKMWHCNANPLIFCYPSSAVCSWNFAAHNSLSGCFFVWVFFNHRWPDILLCLSCSFLWRRRGKRSVRSTSPWGSMLSRPRSELWDAVRSISSAVSFPRKCFKLWFVWTFAVGRKYGVLLCNNKCLDCFDWQFVSALIFGVSFSSPTILLLDV
jgi:hypothetical protein